jgi:branched-chain amino acid transport system substrate-binding protein
MSKRLFPAAALAVAVAITLGACSAPATDDGEESVPGIIGSEIQIAISSPESGPGAVAAAYASGMRAYLDEVNRQGGIEGYTFNVTTFDNAGNAAGGAQAIRQIISNEPFFTAVTGSAAFQAAVEVLKTQAPELPLVGFGNAQLVKDSGLENVFGFFPNYIGECYLQVDYAMEELGFTDFALVYEDSATGQGAATNCPGYAEEAGAEMTSYAVPPPAVSTNYGPIAAQIAAGGHEVALFFGSNGELVGLQKAAFSIGGDMKWMAFAPAYDITYFELTGEAGVGTYFDAFAQPVNSDTEQAELFRTVMAQRAPNAANSPGAYGWSYGAIIELAVKTALEENDGDLTQEGFLEALRNLKTEGLGMLYSVDYTVDTTQITSQLNIYEVTPDGLDLVVEALPVPSN